VVSENRNVVRYNKYIVVVSKNYDIFIISDYISVYADHAIDKQNEAIVAAIAAIGRAIDRRDDRVAS